MSNPNIFFIIGAPTSLTVQRFDNFIKNNGNVKLVICADMPTYIKALKSSNVVDTPTNFRAHADDKNRTFFTAHGDITTNSTEEFQKLQEDIATSLYEIFKKANEKKIKTYFGIVPRDQRPLLLHKNNMEPDGDKKDERGKQKYKVRINPDTNKQWTPEEDRAKGAHATKYSPPYIMKNANITLTEKIRDELLIPKVYKSPEKLYDIINNKDISKYGATFLSDMITVGCAGLIDNNVLWDSYTPTFGEGLKTIDAVYSGNNYSKFGKGLRKSVCVKQENLKFEEQKTNENATFFGYKSNEKSIGALNEILEAMIDQNTKSFGNCYVWHDDELNDLDDLPAIGLIEKLANNVQKDKNYKKEGTSIPVTEAPMPVVKKPSNRACKSNTCATIADKCENDDKIPCKKFGCVLSKNSDDVAVCTDEKHAYPNRMGGRKKKTRKRKRKRTRKKKKKRRRRTKKKRRRRR